MLVEVLLYFSQNVTKTHIERIKARPNVNRKPTKTENGRANDRTRPARPQIKKTTVARTKIKGKTAAKTKHQGKMLSCPESCSYFGFGGRAFLHVYVLLHCYRVPPRPIMIEARPPRPKMKQDQKSTDRQTKTENRGKQPKSKITRKGRQDH